MYFIASNVSKAIEMKTIEKENIATYEVKRSKFISHLVPYPKFQSRLEELRKEHPKARHFVYGFRYLNEFGQVVEGSSDDGEPKGTSGKPTLNVLIGYDLVNVAIITVRYFGGIKLGTGGLVKAYSTSANLVIQQSQLIEYRPKERREIAIPYSEISKFEYQIQKLGIEIIRKSFDEVGGRFLIEGEKEKLEKITNYFVG